MITRRRFLQLSAASAAAGFLSQFTIPALDVQASVQTGQTALGGGTIDKYVEPVPVFGPAGPIPRVKGLNVTVTVSEIQQKVLPTSFYATLADPYKAGTYVWAYNVNHSHAIYPGVSIEAFRHIPTNVTYVNNLPLAGSKVQQYLTVDQSIHWAKPTGAPMMVPNPDSSQPGTMIGNPTPYNGPLPMVTHLHGAQVSSRFDGGPDQWFTPDGKLHGGGYDTYKKTAPNSAVYHYPNDQEATSLWFHDHTLGATRVNVYAGLAAFYLLRDRYDTGLESNPLNLPGGPYEIELVIQDRQFDTNGQWFFPDDNDPAGLNGTVAQPLIHPFWIPEFFGDVMVVNGKSWPYLEVEPRRYRFHLLDGCNARFLELALKNTTTSQPGPDIWVIGTDGGLLDGPAHLDGNQHKLLIAPSERYDVIIDFGNFKGQTLTLLNSANAPYPGGDPPDPETNGQIMQFKVNKALRNHDHTFDPSDRHATLRKNGGKTMPSIIRLSDPKTGHLAKNVNPQVTRQLILREVEGPEDGGPIEVLINNTKWNGLRDGTDIPVWSTALNDGHGDYLTELPRVGATEIWEIINLTEDAHPIHVHLIQFQLLNRQLIDGDGYTDLYDSLFPSGKYPGLVGNSAATALWDSVDYAGGVFIPGFGPPLPYNGSDPRSGGKLGGNPDVTPFLQGEILLPNPEEAGWKDTVKMFPGTVSRIVVRFQPQDIPINAYRPGKNLYGFDPTEGPGYVWHCHILDHEDNEMMRPYKPIK